MSLEMPAFKKVIKTLIFTASKTTSNVDFSEVLLDF